MNLNFFNPTRVITAKDCIKNNSDIFAKYGNKCLIVTGKASAKKSGALDDVTAALEKCGIEYTVFDSIEQNPSFSSCVKASEQAGKTQAEFIIGIGGGSPLDAAKAIAVLTANPCLSADDFYGLKWKSAPLPVIAVGTTAGTGSEVTAVAVITAPDGMKKSIKAPTTYPAAALGDPSYTLTLSPDFTRSTALDALSHCVESYFNREANDISRTFAIRGILILLEMLPKTAACDSAPLSYEDREKLYCASLYGGYAINTTGTAFPHALGYFLSEKHGVAHGNACAVYLEEFLKHNENVAREDMENFLSFLRTDMKLLVSLIKENLPDLGITLTREYVHEMSPRYENNKSLKKCFGNVDGAFAIELIEKLFVK